MNKKNLVTLIAISAMLLSLAGCQEKLGGGVRSIAVGTVSKDMVYGIRAGKKLGFVIFTNITGVGSSASGGSSWTGEIVPKEGMSVQYEGDSDGLAINKAGYKFTNGRVFLVETMGEKVAVQQLDIAIGDGDFEKEIDLLVKREEIQTFLQLDSFMEKWGEYQSMQVPMDPQDEPLLQAALKKDPGGPWAHYLLMRFGAANFDARSLDKDKREAHYMESLKSLKPAYESLTTALKANPHDRKMQSLLSRVESQLAFATLEAGLDLSEVKSLAESLLSKNKDAKSFYHGDGIFQGHTLLGRVALREGKLEEAKKHLLAAGRTPGSPVLGSFGPSFVFARELALKGEYDTVITFLDLVARFWANPDEKTEANARSVASRRLRDLERWKGQLRAGEVPDSNQWR